MSEKSRLKFSFANSWKAIVAVLMLLLVYVFFRNERHELGSIGPQLKSADSWWIFAGTITSGIYISLQSLMYIQSFRAVGLRLSFPDAVELFLKRNFLSVFLPVGGVSALAFVPDTLKKKKYNTNQVYRASVINGYIALFTVFLVGVPVVMYTLFNHQNFGNSWLFLLILVALLSVLFWAAWSFRTKGILYRLIERKKPDFAQRINDLFSGDTNKNALLGAVFFSTLIEFCCIAIVYIAMRAIGGTHSLEVAAVGYIISVIFMSVSPFLRGLGAVEFSLLLIFQQYGYSNGQSLSITILYRIFEFWLPLVLGVVAFVWRGRQILARVIPAILMFTLGIVNILSASTLPFAERWSKLVLYLPSEAAHVSNLMTLILGIALIFTSVYLIKGFRTAWILGIVFGVLSIIGHIGKGLDYEEAIFGAFTLVMLITSRKQYRILSSERWLKFGLNVFIMVLASIFLFDLFAFYFVDKRHFGIDFTWQQSVTETLRSFLFFSDNQPIPHLRFGVELLYITRFLGFFSWLLLLYTLLRPRIFRENGFPKTADKAEELLQKLGTSSNDYFKIQRDKQIWFSQKYQAFASFRTTNNFAFVLEEPVCEPDEKTAVVNEFESFCHTQNLKPVYYRVDEDSLLFYRSLHKKSIKIGQEAVVDVTAFTLEGKDRKSLRNALNALEKKGFTTSVISPPHPDELLSELKSVSDEWLTRFDKKEMVFSQGMFDADTLRNQPVIVVKDENNAVVSFLNIIPTYGSNECTYDLIRRTEDSPGGCMDAMIIKLIEYAKSNRYAAVNMGLVPLSGIENPDNTAEQIMKFASQKVGSLKHFQSLQFFKEKYAHDWQNKYLIFDNDFDLLQIPATLGKVMKP